MITINCHRWLKDLFPDFRLKMPSTRSRSQPTLQFPRRKSSRLGSRPKVSSENTVDIQATPLSPIKTNVLDSRSIPLSPRSSVLKNTSLSERLPLSPRKRTGELVLFKILANCLQYLVMVYILRLLNSWICVHAVSLMFQVMRMDVISRPLCLAHLRSRVVLLYALPVNFPSTRTRRSSPPLNAPSRPHQKSPYLLFPVHRRKGHKSLLVSIYSPRPKERPLLLGSSQRKVSLWNVDI